MTTPNASPTDKDILDFSDAPGGDMSLDDLFSGNDGLDAQPTTATTPETPSAPPQATPQTPNLDDMFLDAGSSKYKTREEAIRGFAHKDEVIEQLRSVAIQATGIDPLTGQKVAVPRSSSSQSPTGVQPSQWGNDNSYLNNPAKYSNDLRKAVAQNDEQAYMRVQAQLAREQMMQDLAPVVPMFQQFAVQQAVTQTATKNPEFKGFYGTPDYQKALDARPILKSAILNAEGNLEFQQQLPELYSLAYEVAQLQKMSELVKAQQSPSTPPARPTTTPSQLAPPSSSGSNANWRTNQDSAKNLVDDYEKRMGIR